MSEFQQSIDIDAPPAVVWDVLVDIERWPEWTASVERATMKSDGPLALGSVARLKQPDNRAANWRVTQFDPRHSFTWISSPMPGVRADAIHQIEPRGEGSRVTLTVTTSGFFAPLLNRLIMRASARFMPMEAAGLKKRSE